MKYMFIALICVSLSINMSFSMEQNILSSTVSQVIVQESLQEVKDICDQVGASFSSNIVEKADRERLYKKIFEQNGARYTHAFQVQDDVLEKVRPLVTQLQDASEKITAVLQSSVVLKERLNVFCFSQKQLQNAIEVLKHCSEQRKDLFLADEHKKATDLQSRYSKYVTYYAYYINTISIVMVTEELLQ